MPKVFISYIQENKRDANRLAEELHKYGLEVFIDIHSLMPGSRWPDVLKQAIVDGDYFIACFSREYNRRRKSYMNEELLIAIDQLRLRPVDTIWLIPVKFSNCEIPNFKIGQGDTLRSIQWINLFDDWEVGIRKIVEVIKPGSTQVNKQITSADESIWIPCDNILNHPELLNECMYRYKIEDLDTLTLKKLNKEISAIEAFDRIPIHFERENAVGIGDEYHIEKVSFITEENEIFYDIVPQTWDCYDDDCGVGGSYIKSGKKILDILNQKKSVRYIVIYRWDFDGSRVFPDSNGYINVEYIKDTKGMEIIEIPPIMRNKKWTK